MFSIHIYGLHVYSALVDLDCTVFHLYPCQNLNFECSPLRQQQAPDSWHGQAEKDPASNSLLPTNAGVWSAYMWETEQTCETSLSVV